MKFYEDSSNATSACYYTFNEDISLNFCVTLPNMVSLSELNVSRPNAEKVAP